MKNKLITVCNILIRKSKVIGLPIHLQVEITNACNLRCATCHRDLLYPNPTMMKLETFKKLVDEVSPEKINLSGLGEPFLNPDVFKMIRYAKQKGAAVNCATNFTCVRGRIDKVLDSGIDQLKVSIDAANRKTFLRIRGRDEFDTVVESIKELNCKKRERDFRKPVIRFNFALQRENIDELLETIELAHSLEVKAMYIQYLEYIDREDRKKHLVANLTQEKIKSVLKKADKLAKKYLISTNINIWMKDINLFWNKMLPPDEFQPNCKKCYFPWFTSWIDADGTVRPCPIIPWQSGVACMGNVNESLFREIWNNDDYQKLRSSLAKGKRPTDPCRTCIPQSLYNIFQIGTKLLPK